MSIVNYSINRFFRGKEKDVMGFLNEIQLDHPDAISFASGRPNEQFFDCFDLCGYMDLFITYYSQNQGKSEVEVRKLLMQYNRSKGFINELVCEYFKNDETIVVDPSDIIMTVGAQEAMVLILKALIGEKEDILLVEDPSYIGISNLAKILQINVHSVKADDEGIDLSDLEEKIIEYRGRGEKVKLVYVIPNFQNPNGSYMPLKKRRDLLSLAVKYNFLIVEDNAYGVFTYEEERLPSLKSLDENGRVLLIYSFSKIVYPGLRLAALISDQEIIIHDSKSRKVSDILSEIKGYVTVNTPSLSQMAFGGLLVSNQCSLSAQVKLKTIALRERRDAMVDALEKKFNIEGLSKNITWQVPKGGFFMKLTLPFDIDDELLYECVTNYKVIFCPMWFFSLKHSRKNEVRLAFSNVSVNDIYLGVSRLCLFVKDKCDAIL